MQKRRKAEPEDFAMFLSWLESNPDAACQTYEEIRLRLVKIFVCRGCSDPEFLADETIDRVILKIRDIKADYVGDAPIKYIYGVARKIHLEFLRQNKKMQTVLNDVRASPVEFQNAESDCLNYCLKHLPAEQVQIFLDYYEDDNQPKINVRKELADKLNLDVNALRVKIYRIRQLLKDCLERCLEKK